MSFFSEQTFCNVRVLLVQFILILQKKKKHFKSVVMI